MGCNLCVGEDLIDTAQREVLEETGVECEFVSLLAFRHQHNYRFGCSDIYFICVMRPITQEIKPCPREVSDCQWMDVGASLLFPVLNYYFIWSGRRCFFHMS